MGKRKIRPRDLLILGLAFLWFRNAPMALFLPLWTHGDEIGYFDYVMKIGRGHLPRPDEYIEPAVFRLHKGHYDGRYISRDRKMTFVMPSDLGLAAYSYEAQHPPLAPLVFAAFRWPMKAAGLPLLAQAKGLRLVALLAMTAGLTILYRALRRRPDLGLFWHAPLLFIPLLAQDMYVSINTDAFAFLSGCGVIWAIFRLFERPLAAGRWALLALGVALAMWMKATCVFFFGLWPVVAVVLFRSTAGPRNRRRLAALALVFFVMAGALASPWYIHNHLKSGGAVGYILEGREGVPFVPQAPAPLQWPRVIEFKNAFSHTLIRGELFWNGIYLDGFPQPWNRILISHVFWIIFAAGLTVVFLPMSKTEKTAIEPFFVLAAAGCGAILSLFVLHFFWGGVIYYLARYAFGGLYPIILIFAAGCRRLIPEDRLAVVLPGLVLLAYNAAYTYRLVIRVLAPN